jgi:hypothetical protein
VILDTNGNIFGGFTPVEWESPANAHEKADDSLKSFLFTLKNPHNIPAKRFALKAEKKHRAIFCDSRWGLCFSGCDINVYNHGTKGVTQFGDTYTNDTGLYGKIVFTGSEHFQVEEIEVFEIAA